MRAYEASKDVADFVDEGLSGGNDLLETLCAYTVSYREERSEWWNRTARKRRLVFKIAS